MHEAYLLAKEQELTLQLKLVLCVCVCVCANLWLCVSITVVTHQERGQLAQHRLIGPRVSLPVISKGNYERYAAASVK